MGTKCQVDMVIASTLFELLQENQLGEEEEGGCYFPVIQIRFNVKGNFFTRAIVTRNPKSMKKKQDTESWKMFQKKTCQGCFSSVQSFLWLSKKMRTLHIFLLNKAYAQLFEILSLARIFLRKFKSK